MSGINKVVLVGRVGAEPDVKELQSGMLVNLRLATSEQWRDKSGERRERTDWHAVVIFNDKLAAIASKHVRKGDLVGIEGALQTRKWMDRDGNDRYVTEVVLQKFRGELHLLGSRGEALDPARTSETDNDLDDDIPF